MSVGGGDIILAADMNRALRGGPERPMCILRKTTVTSVADAGQVLTWDTEDLDTDGWHSTSSNTSRITPTKAGWIELSACVVWSVNATNRRGVGFKLNGGTTVFGNLILATATASQNVAAVATREFQVNGSTDYLECFAYQNSGGALSTADVTSTFFSAKWIRE